MTPQLSVDEPGGFRWGSWRNERSQSLLWKTSLEGNVDENLVNVSYTHTR